ncbi:MAG: amidohydrolase family protein [Pseudomonadota bacterium]
MSDTRGKKAIGGALLAMILLALTSPTRANPVGGLYFDPDRAGHGFDLRPVGASWVIVFYTYDTDGQPEWMLGVLASDGDAALSGSLDVFDYQEGREPRQATLRRAGDVRLDFAASCGGGAGIAFDWTLDGDTGAWCVQSLLDQAVPPPADFSGLWFAPDDAGWGLSLAFEVREPDTTEVQILFYYDDAGLPRWALGSGSGGAESSLVLNNFRGYCRTCEPVPLASADAGEISHALAVRDGLPIGSARIDVAYALGAGRWDRETERLLQLSSPQAGLIPVPAVVEPDRPIAIVDTTVVPMNEPDVVRTHQTVVVEAGAIVAVGDVATVVVPDRAVRIDGRGRFVGPGLHDMHTHFTFGGVTPMFEAGTLFIANGVTTVLNMGDGGTQNLPGTDAVFGAGTRIGPTVYAGKAAYGAADGRAASATVTSPAAATAYAEQAQAEGYRFLKLYNALTPTVVSRFIDEGERLGMPVNGHLPKTMSMRQALEGGQGMIAHVAEIYFTLLGNQPNEALLPEAAALMLEHDVYLTDTLTASESFAANYGGNEANFEIFSRREGIQYQPTTFAERGWRNFFESSTLQPPGSRPGQLDARLAFFKQMVRFFSDAGVPLILGTDSPGHVGVISGFSVHENLRLYDEIGLQPFAAYAAASRNPGRYLSDSLGEAMPWGTVEVGMRADLLLLEANPLDDLVHLKRPLGVMTRGRFYGRTHLDEALQALDLKYRDPFTRKAMEGAFDWGREEVCDHQH